MRAALFLSVLAIAAPARPERTPRAEQPRSPQEQFIGDWRLVKVGSGTPRREWDVSNMVLRVAASETIFMVDGVPSKEDGLTAAYSIDWSTNPAVITFRPKQRGGQMPGILKIEGDTLTLGLTTSGEQRPGDFASAQMIAYYKRVGR